ncbi:MAG: enoyl-CoA hydratase-related protein [Rhodocyclaceae bacterium]|nr:enoyl-CoA hydratase-related protein [Rhodocyclaceae bacterium]
MSNADVTRKVHVDDPTQLIRTENKGGVLLATIDMPGRTMNVFSWALMDALEMLIERIRSDITITSAVITSGKPSFLAGADLDMVNGFAELAENATPEVVHETTGRLGRLFVRLEALPKPTVAAVNGLALGGGLELAMSCSYRIAMDDPRIQLGLPEIKLGLLPGGGGTQRMPRLMGIEKACELLLNGLSVAPREAKTLGLVNEVVAADQLVPRALAVAADLASKGIWPKLPQKLDPGPFDLSAPDAVRQITKHLGYSEETVAKYPAYNAITRAVVEGADLPMEQGDSNEMWRFVDLMVDEAKTAANMLRTLFLNRQIADKLVAGIPPEARNCRFSVQASGKAAVALAAALSAAKASLVAADVAGEADIVIRGVDQQTTDAAHLILLDDAEDCLAEGNTGIVLKSSPQYGLALEIVQSQPNENAKGRALALAKRLRATPFIHSGTKSLLAALSAAASSARSAGIDENGILLAQALAASHFQAAGSLGDVRFADVASVVSGVYPAFTGGPFTFISLLGEKRLAEDRAAYAKHTPHLFA